MTLVVRIMEKYTRVAGYGTGLEMEERTSYETARCHFFCFYLSYILN